MRLKKLVVSRLFGTVDLNISFFDSLNLFVGINGSGKTTALTVIEWLTRPDFGKLVSQSYNHLALEVLVDGVACTIEARSNENQTVIHILGTEREMPPIVYDHSHFGSMDQSEIEEFVAQFGPDKIEQEAWDFLHKLNTPTFISLERTIRAEAKRQVYSEVGSKYERRAASKRTMRPLEHIQRVLSSRYSQYRIRAQQIDTELKARLVLSALDSPSADEPVLPKLIEAPGNIDQLEHQVAQYLISSLNLEDVNDRVRSFFSYFRELSAEVSGSPQPSEKFQSLIQSQFQRVDELSRAFKEYEAGISEAFAPLKRYIDTVNKFLIDSGKNVLFDEGNGRLAFTGGLGDGSENEPTSVAKLSSGETQIIVLLAFMAFETPRGSVFIVDEPELSLHPKWQSEFMNALLSLSPTDTQIVVATHSPEIVGEHKDACLFFPSEALL